MQMKKTLQKGSCKNYCGHICVCGDLYTYRDESNSVFGCSDNGSSFDLTIYWGSKVQNRKEIISGNSRRNLLFPLILFEDKESFIFISNTVSVMKNVC